MKKKGKASTSWDEAGALFFSSQNGKEEEKESSAHLRDGGVEQKSFSARPSDGSAHQKSFSAQKNWQSRPHRMEREPDTTDSANAAFGRNGRKQDRGKNAFDNGKFSYGRNGERGFSKGGERSTARVRVSDGRFARKQSSDVYDGEGVARSKVRDDGFRKQFSGVDDSTGMPRRKVREGGFRKQFSDIDGGKGMARNKVWGGGFARKQISDVDDGERMPRGRVGGGGFARKQFHDMEDDKVMKPQYEEEENGRKRSFGEWKKGPTSAMSPKFSYSKGREEASTTSEDDDSEGEEIPEAGDVIRYNAKGRSRTALRFVDDDSARKQFRGVVDDDYTGEQEEEEEEEEADNTRRNIWGWKKELPSAGSTLPKLKGEVIYGVGPVYAALQISRREFFCLYVQVNMPMDVGNASKKKDKKALEWVIRSAIERGLEVKEISKHDLNMLVDNRPHQGLVLDASPLELVLANELDAPLEENGKAPVWVALDEVTDPQNFGAILRSAYFLGAAGVVVCAKNSAPLSAVVSKASAGALEVMEIRSCKNMMKFLGKSSENGWRVVGATAAGSEIVPVRELPRGLATILVLGGEGKGLRTNVKMACDHLVCIPGLCSESQPKPARRKGFNKKEGDAVDLDGEDGKPVHDLKSVGEDFIAVESLNVSVAAGILLHELLNSQSAAQCSALVEAV